jgi:cytidine deaminase
LSEKEFSIDRFEPSELLKEAVSAREHAYAPYSHFAVGAALLTGSGKIYRGCNIENASYGATICAERVAITSALAAGEREFLVLAVASDCAEPAPPCGICRQVLAEFAPQLPIYLVNLQGKVVQGNLGEYLPQAFYRCFMEGKDK